MVYRQAIVTPGSTNVGELTVGKRKNPRIRTSRFIYFFLGGGGVSRTQQPAPGLSYTLIHLSLVHT